MKRMQIMLEPELRGALDQLARKVGVSRAELVRRFILEHVKPWPPIEEDPIWEMVGADADSEPYDPDDVLYPR